MRAAANQSDHNTKAHCGTQKQSLASENGFSGQATSLMVPTWKVKGKAAAPEMIPAAWEVCEHRV